MELEEFSISELEGDTFLVLVDYENFRKVANEITRSLVEKGSEGIYFTTDRTYETLSEEFSFEGIDLDKLYFIDVVSKIREVDPDDDNVEFIDSPNAFNDISITFTKFFERMDGEGFVVLDSFTSYLLYGNLKDVGNFVNKMVGKTRRNDSEFYIIAMATQVEEEVLEKLGSICDETLDFVEVSG